MKAAMKKLAAVFLTLTMALMIAVPASAQEGSYSITITPTTVNHTYDVYQIFTGDVSGTDDNTEATSGYTLANVEWGSSINDSEGFLDALQNTNSSKYNDCTTAADVAEKLMDAADLDEFLGVLNTGGYLGTAAATQKATGESVTINLSKAGYYLVKDTLATGDFTNESVSDYIVQVLGQEEMAPKSDVPEVKKEVKDINDSIDEAETYSNWQKSADYDIGDTIPFRISATVGTDYANYDEYAFTIHDEQSDGLTFNAESVVVKVDDVAIQTGYDVKTTGLDNDTCDFEVVFGNLKDITSVTAGSVITVEYNAELNNNAVIGSAGNPNEVYLEYSNDPNSDSKGKTPEDTVIVFTYKVEVNKVDEESQPLAGAQFTLEKWIASEEGGATGAWSAVERLTIGGLVQDKFTFTGLDDGKYRLKETVTPAGYNTIDPIVFTVTAGHQTDVGTSAAYAAPTASGNYVNAQDEVIDVSDAFDFDAITGGVSTNVVNESGSLLPETGGIGTTIFYVLGGILVVGAGILLVVRFRMRESNK